MCAEVEKSMQFGAEKWRMIAFYVHFYLFSLINKLNSIGLFK